MPYIRFTKIWEDSDGMLEIELSASNDRYASLASFYTYPDELQTFAKRLQEFPASTADQILFEYGKDDEKYPSYLRIKVILFDKVGHSAIEIKTSVNGDMRVTARSSFSLSCNPAEINAIGKKIENWIRVKEEGLYYEWLVADFNFSP